MEGLILLSPDRNGIKVNAKAFQKMNRLRLLHLSHIHLNGGYEHISRKLVWLRWHGFNLNFLPSQLYVENLVALDLSHSMIKQVWKGTKVKSLFLISLFQVLSPSCDYKLFLLPYFQQILVKLKFLYLNHCYYLTSTPDFSGLSNLEELFLDNCIRLVEVDGSIRYLQKLLVLDLTNCIRLRKLPSGPWMLNTKILNLSGCSKLEAFAKFQGATSKSGYSLLSSRALRTKSDDSILLSLNSVQGLRCLKLLRMANCGLSNIPIEIGTLIQLECLDLVGNKFSSLPDNISNLTNLVHLNLNYCARLQSLPKLSASLQFVEVQNCTSLERVSLESDWQHTDMLVYNCPQLDENYFANELGRTCLQGSVLSLSLSQYF